MWRIDWTTPTCVQFHPCRRVRGGNEDQGSLGAPTETYGVEGGALTAWCSVICAYSMSTGRPHMRLTNLPQNLLHRVANQLIDPYNHMAFRSTSQVMHHSTKQGSPKSASV